MMNYMKIMNVQNDQKMHEIQTLFDYAVECQQKQFSQLQLLTFSSLLFQLKTAHSAADRLELELELELTSVLAAVKFSKYTSVCVSIESSVRGRTDFVEAQKE